MLNTTFTYQYSAKQHREIEDIRNKYLPKEEKKIEILKKLDNRVQTAGTIPALCVGIIGCLIFGIGMCFGLDVFIGADWLPIVFGGAGVLIMLPSYHLYKHFHNKTKAKLTPEILRLSEEIMQK